MSSRPRLVRIPRAVLHVGLDDLVDLGVPEAARSALVGLLADLPAIPGAEDGALLVGSRAVALPCFAVLARHVAQGLRDHNVTLMHDKSRLRSGRLKLLFLSQSELLADLLELRPWAETESALFLRELESPLPAALKELLQVRADRGLATFGCADRAPRDRDGWRRLVELGG